MAAKLTRLTHKITIQMHLVAESLPFAVLAPGGQSGNFWIQPHILFHCAVFRNSICIVKFLCLLHIKVFNSNEIALVET
jgi:hypothetical protein